MLPRGGPSSDPRTAGQLRLQIIPVLIAITWIVVAAIRIDQLIHSNQTTSDVAQLWAVVSLTALAAIYLGWQQLNNRAARNRELTRALQAVSRLERITDVDLAELPTDELLEQLVERVRDALSADAAVLMMPAGDRELAIRAVAGLEVTEEMLSHRVQLGAGLAGQVAVRKAPVAMSDLSMLDPKVSPLRSLFASAAAAPLLINGEVTGVLVIANSQPTRYHDDEVRLLALAAQRCAHVAEAARLRDAEYRLNLGAEHARRHLGLLVDASRIFMESVSDFETGLVRLVELAVRDFAGFGAVYLAQGHEGLKLLVAQHNLVGPNAELHAFRDLQASSLGAVRRLMASGKSLLVKTLDPTAHEDQDPVRDRLHALGVTSYVMAPIQVRGLAYGALIFGTVGKMRGFRPSDQGATEELARRAALAIEASLLYREAHESADLAESRAERLARLLEVWLSISTALDKPDGLEVAAAGARRVLDARRGYVAFASSVYDGGAIHADSKAAPVLPESLWPYLCDFHQAVRDTAPDLPPMPADAAAALAGLHWLAAPLRPSQGGDAGCVLVVTDGLGFTPEDESLLVLLSQMIGTSLTNAQLHAMTRENEARLTALIESSPVAIVDLALDGGVRSWNAAAATLFDWPADAASGWHAAFDQPMAGWIKGLVEEAKDGAVAHFECSYQREDGAEKALVLSVSPVPDQHGGVPGMLLVANDETERRQLARQFQEAQRLEAVGRMAGAVAHDFNNLLTIIIGYADSLLRRMDEHDPQRERIATIARAGNRGAALTRQLLAVSRRQVIAPIVLRPVDVLIEVESLITRLVGEDVTVRVQRDGDTRPIRVDKNQFEQAILNLAANARDAMREGGELTFDVVTAPDPSYVAIRVIDNGVGMDDETLAHCLEPFYTTKDRGEGTGLGLAAVYGIITQGGGDVSIASRVGQGTTVSLLMPAVDAPLDYSPTQELPTPHSESRVNSGYILLIEDEHEVRSLVRRMLRERGYTVLQAPSAQHALALLNEYDGPLDLMITDVVMPGMKGPELARRVALERRLPVLFISGYAEELVDMPPDFEAPTAFLAKPFSPDQLVDAVRKLIAVDRAAIAEKPESVPPQPAASPADVSEPHVAIATPEPDKSDEWD
jgi:two-component system cell cycle sensor histidine kinase/response regulator CckA